MLIDHRVHRLRPGRVPGPLAHDLAEAGNVLGQIDRLTRPAPFAPAIPPARIGK